MATSAPESLPEMVVAGSSCTSLLPPSLACRWEQLHGREKLEWTALYC